MARTAVLRAEQVIAPRLGRLKPDVRVAAGQDVCLHAEGWHEHIVNDVLGSHDQFDDAAQGYVNLVDLTLSVQVLKLPHPLFADHINVQSLIRWARHREEHTRTPHENDSRDK